MHTVYRGLYCETLVPYLSTLRLQAKEVEDTFTFDACFGPDATQADVFSDVKRLVQTAADGYNVCIFAYGQASRDADAKWSPTYKLALFRADG